MRTASPSRISLSASHPCVATHALLSVSLVAAACFARLIAQSLSASAACASARSLEPAMPMALRVSVSDGGHSAPSAQSCARQSRKMARFAAFYFICALLTSIRSASATHARAGFVSWRRKTFKGKQGLVFSDGITARPLHDAMPLCGERAWILIVARCSAVP